MSSHRMARKPSSLLSLFLLICFHAATIVSCIQLTDEILHFVPDCAKGCFESFLDVNYQKNPCSGGLTSLQCLCANRGASGFTIGEGLVQCIAAEKAIKFCSDEEASDANFNEAFNMCNGKPNAIRATNTVFTATLLLPPSGPGVISFPPITTTRTNIGGGSTAMATSVRTFTNPASSEPTLVTDTSPSPTRAPSSGATSGFSTSTRAASTGTSGNGDAVPDIPAGDGSNSDTGSDGKNDSQGGSSSKGLSTAQVAGISVGVASAAGLAAIAIFLARYYRRQRRLPDIRSLFTKRDSWPYQEKGGGGDRDGGGGGGGGGITGGGIRRGVNGDRGDSGSLAGIARQIQQPLDANNRPGPRPAPAPAPAAYPVAGFYSPAIGVAVASPTDQYNAQQQNPELPTTRPTSPLLPAKPIYIPPVGMKRKSKSPPSSEVFSNATMVRSPERRLEASPRQRGPSPSPLTLADTITTRQQPSPVPPGAQQSPKRFPATGPMSSVAAGDIQTQQPSFKPTYSSNSNTTVNTNKPQPPLPQSSFAKKINAPPPAVLERDSAVTEFEEDGRISARSTGLSTNSKKNSTGGGQVWYPPSAHPSGLTYYFSDQSGNWVLRDSQQEQQLQRPQQYDNSNTKNSSYKKSNQESIHPALRTSTSLAPAAEISRALDQRASPAPQFNLYPRSSSVYSPSMPRPLFSGPRRSSHNAGNPPVNRRSSGDSGVTQFSAASSSGDAMDQPPPLGSLSPVAESPPDAVPRGGAAAAAAAYPGGRLPGQYHNNINASGNGMSERRNQNNLRLAAGPPRSARPYHPPGQPSPTLGLMNPPPGPAQDRPAANSSYSRYQNPYSRAFYGNPPPNTNNVSSSTLRVVSPSPPPDRDLLPSNSNGHGNDTISPLSPLKPSAVFPPSTTGPWRPPMPATNNSSSSSSTKFASSSGNYSSSSSTANMQPVELPANSPTPSSSANTTASSSLLAKRLGPGRAADMTFPAVRPPSTQGRWQQREDGVAGRNGLLSPQTPGHPGTPTWVPKLTPTRRGDDLFLNVQ